MDYGHIFARFMLHIALSGTAYFITFYALDWFRRKTVYWFRLVIPAALYVGAIGWAEPLHIAAGDPVAKSYFDLASWIIGMVLVIWSLHKFKNWTD